MDHSKWFCQFHGIQFSTRTGYKNHMKEKHNVIITTESNDIVPDRSKCKLIFYKKK